MNKTIEKILACPECKSGLSSNNAKLRCKKCKKDYRIVDGVPSFLEKPLVSEEIASDSFKNKLIGRPMIRKLADILGPPDTTYESNEKIKKQILKDGIILNIGSSSKKVYSNTINFDIGKFENVDVVGDGKKLPFKNNSFDVVLIESVLEHIDEPEIVIKEGYRVLKKGGKIYISIPFVFAFHGSPDDFNRYTLHGLAKRLKLNDFSKVRGGVLSGPGSTASQVLRYYLALLFSFNSDFLFSLFLNIFGWLTFFLKYTDIFLGKYKKAHVLAACVWAVGEK